MKKTMVVVVFLVAGLLAAARTASAAKNYISGDIGIGWMNNITDTYSTSTYGLPMFFQTTNNNRLAFADSGLTLYGAIGSDCGSYRMEGEVGYQRTNVKNITKGISSAGSFLPSSTVTDLEGNVSVISILANGYYDVHGGALDPYITAGVGCASISFNDINAPASNLQYSGSSSNAQAASLAYQIGAGFAVPLSKTIKLDARYRYFATGKVGSIATSQVTLKDFSIISNSIVLGLRVGI
ncbi:MAG: outer membrane beta-barrel protein [Chlorobiaceae bacterium]|jgi:opacity protein-like surface antigen